MTPSNSLATALQVTPLALATVAGIERAAPGLPGQSKAQIAVQVILAAAHTGEAIPVPSVSAIAGLVDLLVSILNASGVFQHKPKPNNSNAAFSNSVGQQGLSNIINGAG